MSALSLVLGHKEQNRVTEILHASLDRVISDAESAAAARSRPSKGDPSWSL